MQIEGRAGVCSDHRRGRCRAVRWCSSLRVTDHPERGMAEVTSSNSDASQGTVRVHQLLSRRLDNIQPTRKPIPVAIPSVRNGWRRA